MPQAQSQARDAAQAAVGVLTAALPVNEEVFLVGEREYVVRELPVDAFLQLGSIVAEQVDALAEAGLLNQDAWQVKGKDYTPLVRMVAKIWKAVPGTVGQALALILSGEGPDDATYIPKHLTPRQLLLVVEAFMRANPWQDLVEGFFRLRQSVAPEAGAAGPQTTTEK